MVTKSPAVAEQLAAINASIPANETDEERLERMANRFVQVLDLHREECLRLTAQMLIVPPSEVA